MDALTFWKTTTMDQANLLVRLVDLLNENGIRYCVIGGQGVNAYVCTVNVPSLDEMLVKVGAAGGMVVVPKMPIPGVGWLAYAQDGQGNIFGMMQADPQAQ